jgi:hypothetical protein
MYCKQKKIYRFGDCVLLNVAPLLLNCHLLGKTSTKRTNVIFVPIGYSKSTAVLPACRKIAGITQKELCIVIGLTNPRLNFGQIFPERAKKRPNSSTILSL